MYQTYVYFILPDTQTHIHLRISVTFTSNIL